MNKLLLCAGFLFCNLSFGAQKAFNDLNNTLHDEATRKITMRFLSGFLVGASQGVINSGLTNPEKNAAPVYMATYVSAHITNGLIHKQVIPQPIDLWALGCGEVIANAVTTHLTQKQTTFFTFFNNNLLLAAMGTGLWFFQDKTKKS